jgi:hypothetical protein
VFRNLKVVGANTEFEPVDFYRNCSTTTRKQELPYRSLTGKSIHDCGTKYAFLSHFHVGIKLVFLITHTRKITQFYFLEK